MINLSAASSSSSAGVLPPPDATGIVVSLEGAAYIGGRVLRLSPDSAVILHTLNEDFGNVVSAGDLYLALHGTCERSDAAVRQAVSRTNAKLEGTGFEIRNRRGNGWALVRQ